MPNTACERWKAEFEKFIQTGEASDEFLAHLDNCEHCGKTVDDAFNRQAKTFEELAEILRQNAAVEQILIPSLGKEAREIALELVEKHGPQIICAAIEAVSVLISEHHALVKKGLTIMKSDGSVFIDGKMEIPVSAIALEIARFTDLWGVAKVKDNLLQPSSDAFRLATWMPKALAYQPRLLRHFKATIRDGDSILLNELNREQRVDDDMRIRWGRY